MAPDEKIQPLHPPDWLIGTWQGSPHSARMEVDELKIPALFREWLIHAMRAPPSRYSTNLETDGESASNLNPSYAPDSASPSRCQTCGLDLFCAVEVARTARRLPVRVGS